MAEHPIEGLMRAALENIKTMVDVNAIVGDPVQTPDGSVILPISRVALGFAAGGSDLKIVERRDKDKKHEDQHYSDHTTKPFGGGSGGGLYITPIAFLIVGKQGVQVVSADNQTHLIEKLIDAVPQVIDRIDALFRGKEMNKNDHHEDIIIP
ncbi:GerW family sporulation protein [Paenibacillus aquistagni]|uniref:Sporulation protein YtfJ n=1 Tax=Paenibacillus aquistagni TaxID=1852522 RepID=A0A1X7JII8_9BACL|nr:GerW family sporulation protein [Paenibacillus aquistagni]NMM54083.1 sporulation protein YtfJ [Paenibacillus aquistagni]SMG27540.1 sporulation protein YtfJ [Paenibacillus aquistagni]